MSNDAATLTLPEASLIDQVIEALPSSLLVLDPQLHVVSANRNFFEKTRRNQQSTVGKPIAEVIPAAVSRYIRLEEHLRRVFATGQPFGGGHFAYRAPGLPRRVFFYRITPLREAQRVTRVLLLFDDLSERERLGAEVREAERHLAQVAEFANDMVISLDPYGAILSWNRAAERISHRAAEEAVGLNLGELCAPTQRAIIATMIAQMASGLALRDIEADLCLNASAQTVPIAWSGAPLRDEQGLVRGFVLVGRDLTERRHLEARMIQSEKIASLGVLAGGIAHELRNPLGIILAASQLMRDQPCQSPLHQQSSERIERAVKRATQIVDHLLRYARPESEREAFFPLALADLLTTTLELLEQTIEHANTRLETQIAAHLAPIVGNPGLLQQALTNVILNALNAMPNGGTLRIAVYAEADQQVIAVHDTGIGIDEAHYQQIFDPFFTTMPVGRGTGLGLAICQSIMRQHGGQIRFTSQRGAGSSFYLCFPRHSP